MKETFKDNRFHISFFLHKLYNMDMQHASVFIVILQIPLSLIISVCENHQMQLFFSGKHERLSVF